MTVRAPALSLLITGLAACATQGSDPQSVAQSPSSNGVDGGARAVEAVDGDGGGRAADSSAGVAPFYAEADLDVLPRPLYRPLPALDPALRRRGRGLVYVLFVVDEHGAVENPRVQDSSDPAFEPAALAAVQRWRFEPGRRGGEAVRSRMRVPVVFGAATPRSWMDEFELGIWNDPKFKKRILESYQAETEIEPGLTEDEIAVMVEVNDLMGADKLDEAAALLRAATNPAASAALDFTLATIEYQREQLARATEAYRIAVDKHPKFRRAWTSLAQVLFREGDYENAANAFSEVIRLGGGDALVHGFLGVARAKLGDAVAAEAAFRRAAMLAPETVEWQLGLAESYLGQRRFAAAAGLLSVLIEQNPDRGELWLAQAQAFAQMKKPLEAAQNLEIADRLGQSTADTLNNLGDIYARNDLYALAADAYLRALRRFPKTDLERAVSGANFMLANGGEAAVRELLDGIEQVRGEGLEVDDRKTVLRLRARIAGADASEDQVRILEQIVALDPMDGEALLRLGRIALRDGDHERAEFYYRRAEGIDRFEADAKVRRAELLVKQGKYAEALPLLRRAQSIEPRDYVQDFLAKIERAAKTR